MLTRVLLAVAMVIATCDSGALGTALHGQQEVVPLSYVCVMAGDEGVLEDKPGICPNPRCGMELVPVRLVAKWWCPTHQTLSVSDTAGQCRFDRKALIAVTLSEFWQCSDDPTRKLMAPAACSSGAPAKVAYELRAHGDHNPQHGGQFFMAENAWHHLEGTYARDGVFRLFFYDNFTKPIAATAFAGTLVIFDNAGREIASVPLRLSDTGTTLEAAVAPHVSGVPLKVAARVRLSPNTVEQRFDFAFSTFTQ